MPEQTTTTKTRAKAAQQTVDAVEFNPERVTLPDGRSMTADDLQAALDQLASPFQLDRIEKLPKPITKGGDKYQCRQGTQASADGYYCGGYHARSIHLDYVGHAGVTDRLNLVDPFWTWEPMALTDAGTPLFSDGGMWIKLTVLGITRLGFGDASGKSGPSAVKEVIGDAIRNAAMRFGVATYLWSKSDAAKALAAGGEPDAEPEPEHRDPIRGDGTQPTPNEHGQKVWAAYNALDDKARIHAQKTWPAGLPGPDYITTAESEAKALEHIAAVYEASAAPDPT